MNFIEQLITTEDGTIVKNNWEESVWKFCKKNRIDIRQTPDGYYTIEGKKFAIRPLEQSEIASYRSKLISVIIDESQRELIPSKNGTSSNGHKYLHKCSEPLIGVDIQLFDNPGFPYAKDRPPCFYQVKVNNNRSAIEAWDDEKLRWEMIKNRIDYAGGWINAKEILNAMNISRTCKQPSWFSEKFAVKIMTNLCTTNHIIDPFAGWGARMTAAISMGKTYEGYDINQDVISWVNRPEYQFGNVLTNKITNLNASVFTCPPYEDFEVYFSGQLLKTTDEWIDIVKENIKAKEYIFVVKRTTKYAPNVVDHKINKSHFGTNDEKVIYLS